MAIRRTTWQPDTCGCILEYDWDDSLPVDQRVHIPATAIACSLHLAHAGDLTGNHATCIAENSAVQAALSLIAPNIPSQVATKTDEWGRQSQHLAPWNIPQFIFAPQVSKNPRVMTMQSSTMTPQEISALQNIFASHPLLNTAQVQASKGS